MVYKIQAGIIDISKAAVLDNAAVRFEGTFFINLFSLIVFVFLKLSCSQVNGCKAQQTYISFLACLQKNLVLFSCINS